MKISSGSLRLSLLQITLNVTESSIFLMGHNFYFTNQGLAQKRYPILIKNCDSFFQGLSKDLAELFSVFKCQHKVLPQS